ncbi:uncharacterized protein BDV17DRAFT_286728 [Aspergillus undulatus]|uniref:uncharacterized protein n=1 Tax=Aspergillus undulatus TaxID=1810928 RepID=UPI003CCDC575
MSDFVQEQDGHQIQGLNYLYFTTTFAHSPSIYAPVVSEFNKSVPDVSAVKNMNCCMSI